MSKFRQEIDRDAHAELCRQHGTRKLEFMPEGACEQVNPAVMSNRSPLVLFFDFETLHYKTNTNNKVHAVLKPISFTYVLVSDDEVIKYGGYVGEDSDRVFIQKMIKLSEEFLLLYQLHQHNIIYTPGKGQSSKQHLLLLQTTYSIQ